MWLTAMVITGTSKLALKWFTTSITTSTPMRHQIQNIPFSRLSIPMPFILKILTEIKPNEQ